MTIHKYALKKSANNVVLPCLLPSKGKVLSAHHHSTTGLDMLKNMKFARVQLLQKGIIGKRMLKVKAGQKGRPKDDVKDSTWIPSFFNFLSSQIKSDDIPTEVKLDDANNTEMGKANKSNKMQIQILFKLSGSMFFKWKK